jgi:hypothetical protein
MRAHPAQPMTKSSLARHLQVPVERRSELRRAIAALIEEGLVEEKKKACYLLAAPSDDTLVGTLKFHPKGHAMFFPDVGEPSNLAKGIYLSDVGRVVI